MRLNYHRKLGWRAWAVAVVIATGGLIAGLTLTSGGSAGALPARTSSALLNEPAHQMAQLNFLLGSFTCATNAKTTIDETTSKILSGNYYQMEISEDIAGKGQFSASWTLGWDPVDLDFTAQYFDNSGITGTATSAGWKNGQFVLPGHYVIVAVPGGAKGIGQGFSATSEDVFRITGKDHYIDDSYILRNGKWVSEGGDDCQQDL